MAICLTIFRIYFFYICNCTCFVIIAFLVVVNFTFVAAGGTPCPVVASGKNCDEWIASHGASDGYTCALLTSAGYNCAGCTCPAPASSAAGDTTVAERWRRQAFGDLKEQLKKP